MIQSYKTTLGAVGSTFVGQLSPGMDFLEVVDAQGTLFFDFADGGRVEASKSDVLYFSPAVPLPQGFTVSSDVANNAIHLRAGRGRSMRLANAGGGGSLPLPVPVTSSENYGTVKMTGTFNAFPSGMLRGAGGGNAELLPLRAQQDGQALITAGDVRTDLFDLAPGEIKQAWLYGAGLVAVHITQLSGSCQVQVADSAGNWIPAPVHTINGFRRSEVGVILLPGLYIIPCPAQQQIRIGADAGNTGNVQGVLDMSRTRESWRAVNSGVIVPHYAEYTTTGTFTIRPAIPSRQFFVTGVEWHTDGNPGGVTFESNGSPIYASSSSATDEATNAGFDGDFLFRTLPGGNLTVTLTGTFTKLRLMLRLYELWS
jgi:hypothetical protein